LVGDEMNKNVVWMEQLLGGGEELVLNSDSRSFPARKSPSHPDFPMSPLSRSIY
jgi:hypothetical protein